MKEGGNVTGFGANSEKILLTRHGATFPFVTIVLRFYLTLYKFGASASGIGDGITYYAARKLGGAI